MPVAPYSPMHEPVKCVSQEQMLATLRRNAKIEVAVSPGVPRCPPLQWNKPVRTGPPGFENVSGYVESGCGKYSVSKSPVLGESVYTAWLCGKPGAELGCYKTPDEAQARCQEHAG